MDKKITHKREVKGSITHVKVDGYEKTKMDVLNDIPKNDYYTYPDGVNGKKGAKVYKTKNGHITTIPNDDTRDNLDSLPIF
jgi:hypothetical protein